MKRKETQEASEDVCADDAASDVHLHDAQLADAALALVHSQTEDDVYATIGDFLTRLAPGVIVIINESTPDLEWLVTRRVAGLEESIIGKAVGVLGMSIIGSRHSVLPEYHDALFGGELTRIRGGLPELAASEVPRPVAEAIVKMVGVRDVFTIGITDGEHVLGNLHILTTAQSAELPTHAVESFVRHCFSALASIRRARDLADVEVSSALLIDSMVEGMALHEIIVDAKGMPCDYRFLDVNHSFEQMTGLHARDIIGHTAREILPRLEQQWIDRYGAVAMTGTAAHFEDYSDEIGKHFGVTVYSPQPGQFVTVVEDITERQSADKALRDSERWLSESQRVAHLGHYIYDIQADWWEGSPALYDVLGTGEDRRGDFEGWLRVVHPADRERLGAYFTDEVLGNRRPFDIEYRIVRPRDGVERWVHGLGTVTYRDDGQPSEMFGIIQDITEHKRTEEALQESRDMLVNLTAQVPGVVYQYRLYPDGSSAFPFASSGMNDIYEVTPEEVREDATPVFGRLHPDDADRVGNDIQESARTLRPFHCEYRVILPRQGLRWRLSDAMPQRTEDGGTLWHGIISDITDRKLLEMDLRESEAQLKRAQHFARLGSWTWNIKTSHLDWSDEMFHLFGLDRATFTGDLSDVIDRTIHPDDRAAVDEANRSVMTEGRPIPTEYRVIWPDGSVHVLWGEAGEMLCDDEGNPSLLSGTVQDITDRKRAEQEIMRLNDDLERRVRERTEELTIANEELLEANVSLDEATRAKSDFLASMSHELRTPLNSIIGFSDILFRGLAGDLEPEQQKQVGMINTAGKYLLELINEVLDLSAIEAGRMRIENSSFDVSGLVTAVAESLRPLATEKGLDLRVEVAPSVTTLFSDRVRLEQVLYNLLGNALKFTDAGSVRVAVEQSAEEVVFSFTDTGRGISVEDLGRIFDEFYQVERHDIAKSQGTGLGLTVSKRLVELLGGSIEVESIHGAGSTFTVRLPRQET